MRAVITFKDDRGRYISVTRSFRDQRHLENYIAKVDGQYGKKYVDHKIIES